MASHEGIILDSTPSIWLQIKEAILEAWLAFILNAPSLLVGFIILVASWVAARIIRVSVLRLTNTVNRLLDRTLNSDALVGARLSTGAMAIIGELAFWLTFFFGTTLALRVAGLTAMADWLVQAGSYIPNILFGVGIIILGYALSRLASEQVANQSGFARTGQHALISRVSQIAIFVISLLIGLDLIGLNVTFLVALFAVAAGAVGLGLSVAFALGAKRHVSNLVGVRAARGETLMGQTIRIGAVTGSVLEVTRSHVVLDTDEGRTLVPGHLIDTEGFALVSIENENLSDKDKTHA